MCRIRSDSSYIVISVWNMAAAIWKDQKWLIVSVFGEWCILFATKIYSNWEKNTLQLPCNYNALHFNRVRTRCFFYMKESLNVSTQQQAADLQYSALFWWYEFWGWNKIHFSRNTTCEYCTSKRIAVYY